MGSAAIASLVVTQSADTSLASLGIARGWAAWIDGTGTIFRDTDFIDNSVKVLARGAASGKASAGELVSDFAGDFDRNTDASVYVLAQAEGGGLYNNGNEARIEAGVFSGNSADASAENTVVKAGGVDTATAAVTAPGSITHRVGTSARLEAKANGGAAAFRGASLGFSGNEFVGNHARATVSSGSVEVLASEFGQAPGARNYANAEASATARGGALSLHDTSATGRTELVDNDFDGNSATATMSGTVTVMDMEHVADSAPILMDAVASAKAAGGAVDFDFTTLVLRGDNYFNGNQVNAINEMVASSGTHGAVVRIDSISNFAESVAEADGGAINFTGTRLEVDGAVFTRNAVTAKAGGAMSGVVWSLADQGDNHARATAMARCGAVFVNTSNGAGLTLRADAGRELTVENNKFVTGSNSGRDGIFFGRAEFDSKTGFFEDSQNATLAVQAEGTVNLLDPVTVEMYSAASGEGKFTMNVTGGGTLVWGGRNVMDATGGSFVTLGAARTVFASDFTLTATDNKDYRTGSADNAYRAVYDNNDLTVTLSGGAYSIATTRSATLALFDFTGSSDGTLDVTGTFSLGVDQASTRDLFGGGWTDYLAFATGLAAVEVDSVLAALAANSNADEILFKRGATLDSIVMSMSKANPYGARLLRGSFNSMQAAQALNGLITDTINFTDDMYDGLMASDPRSVTPEYALNQLHAAMDTGVFVQRSARDLAFGGIRDGEDAAFSAANAYGSAAPAIGTPGSAFRFWAGYGHERSTQDPTSRALGFRTRLNAGLLGLTYTPGNRLDLAAYAGYSRGKTRYGEIESGVDTDGVHAGLLAAWRFSEMLPDATLAVDFGASWLDNDGWRGMALGREKGEFRQSAYTGGLGVEVPFRLGRAVVAPFAEVRYDHVSQRGFNEHGPTGTATRVDGINESRATSTVGAKLSGRFRHENLDITPSLALSWCHLYGSDRHHGNAIYTVGVNPTPASFRVSSTQYDRDVLVINPNLDFTIHTRRNLDVRLNLGGSVEVSKNRVTRSVHASLGLDF